MVKLESAQRLILFGFCASYQSFQQDSNFSDYSIKTIKKSSQKAFQQSICNSRPNNSRLCPRFESGSRKVMHNLYSFSAGFGREKNCLSSHMASSPINKPNKPKVILAVKVVTFKYNLGVLNWERGLQSREVF